MADNGRVYRDCPNAPNPYHECGVHCLEKIQKFAEGKGRKEKKKLDKPNGIKDGELRRKKDGERRVHQTCPKASNPYHECNELCFKSIAGSDASGYKKESGSKILDISRSFGRKNKESESQQKEHEVQDIRPVVKPVYRANAPTPPPRSPKKKVESENGDSFSSSEIYSEEIYSQDNSFNKDQISFFNFLPTSRNVSMSDNHKDLPKDNTTRLSDPTPTKKEDDEKLQTDVLKMEDGTKGEVVELKSFTFTGTAGALEDSDEDDVRSVVSDRVVSVGKYHVNASVSSVLKSIIDKYGDIAANCQLESLAMRSYYLGCVCEVVKELQSTSFMQLTKPKIKEMLAVLKDVECAQIDVGWLRTILGEILEAVELMSKHKGIEEAKASSDHVLESTRRELNSRMEDLAQKEKELAEAKARVAETKARLSDLERECSQLDNTLKSIRSKVDKFQNFLANELL